MTLAIDLSSPPTRVTPEQLLRMPDNSTLELVNGQIVEKNVSAESSRVEGWILRRFGTFLDSSPVADAFPSSLGYRCFPDDPGKIRKPDVTVVSKARYTALPDPDPGYMPIVPDLAVEVVSPNDLVYEVDEKVREYLDAGFPLVWVVDPKTRAVTVHPADGRPTILKPDDEITAEAALPGFRCKVADLFPA